MVIRDSHILSALGVGRSAFGVSDHRPAAEEITRPGAGVRDMIGGWFSSVTLIPD
jgi:hypothetical protein